MGDAGKGRRGPEGSAKEVERWSGAIGLSSIRATFQALESAQNQHGENENNWERGRGTEEERKSNEV